VGGFPPQNIADLHFFENTLIAAPAAGASWLTPWNSTTVPRISPEALRIAALPNKQRMRVKQY